MKRIPSLDGFRAISIILVLIEHGGFSRGFPFHNCDLLLFQMGITGVIIFFVISGFLITYLLLSEEANNGRIGMKNFYIRRIFRIIPVYALYILFVFLMRKIDHHQITKNNLVHFFTFTSNFRWSNDPVFQHFWSLSVEEQFYLIWPVTLILFRKNLKIAIFIFIACSCLSRVISYKFAGSQMITLSPFFGNSDSIFIGAFGGILFFENQDICKLKIFGSYILQITATFLIVLFVYCSKHGKLPYIALPFGNSIVSFSILFLILSYITPSDKTIYKILNQRVIVHIGILSYSIYIWQQFVLAGEIAFWRVFPYNILEVYCISLVSYYLWEKPFLRIKKHFSDNRAQIMAG